MHKNLSWLNPYMLSSVSRELRISLDSCHHVCFSGGDFLCFDFHGKYLFFQHVCHVCSHFNFHGHRRFPQPFGQMIFNVFFGVQMAQEMGSPGTSAFVENSI